MIMSNEKILKILVIVIFVTSLLDVKISIMKHILCGIIILKVVLIVNFYKKRDSSNRKRIWKTYEDR